MSLNDFIQWRLGLILDGHPSIELFHLFRDKIREKIAIAQLGIPTAQIYKIFESPEEIDFSFLPASFVIKFSFQARGRGMIFIKDGIDQRTNEPLDREKIIAFLKPHVAQGIKFQKIIIEELLEAEIPNTPLLDIKIFYFAGDPLFLQIVDPTERPENRIYPRYHYNMKWKRIPMHTQEAPLHLHKEKPECFDEIVKCGNIIAKTFFKNTFIRLDFYPTSKGCVFGETTLCPNFQMTPEADQLLGNILNSKKITF